MVRKPKQQYIGWVYCLPYTLAFLFGTIIPMLYSVYLSLFTTRMVGGTQFVGFENYLTAFKDVQLWNGLTKVSGDFIIQVPFMLICATILALMLDSQRIKHVALPRILLFLPYAVPGVVAALMWGYIYGDRYGLIGQFFRAIGLPAPDLFSGKLILFAIANITTWVYVGYNMLIIYSSLKVLPEELYESARIDGASEFRIAWSVKIPQIKGTLIMTLLFSLIGAFQLFNEPSTLKNMSSSVINSSFTPNMYSYNLAFAGNDINYAAAVSLIVGVITMLIVAVVRIGGNRWEEK